MKKIKEKKKKRKSKLSGEQAFVKHGTTILLIAVFILAIVVSIINIKDRFNLGDSSDISSLTSLSEEFDASAIITNQITDDNKLAFINKITASGLDILTDGEVDYAKYCGDTMEITNNLTLTADDIGLLYSYLFVNNMGEYNAILYQLDFSTTDNGYEISTVASIDFHKLFTSKLATNSDDASSLPRRVYISNSVVKNNDVVTYSHVKYNNLTEEKNKSISNTINKVNNVNLDKYMIDRIITMLNTIATKTNTQLEFKDNCAIFKNTL